MVIRATEGDTGTFEIWGDVMNEKMTGSDMHRIDSKDKQLTLSLMMLGLVGISATLLAAAFLIHQPVGADTAQPGITEVASLETEAEATWALDVATASECVDDIIGPMPILPYADHSFAYGGFYIAEAMWQLMGVDGKNCLQEM